MRRVRPEIMLKFCMNAIRSQSSTGQHSILLFDSLYNFALLHAKRVNCLLYTRVSLRRNLGNQDEVQNSNGKMGIDLKMYLLEHIFVNVCFLVFTLYLGKC